MAANSLFNKTLIHTGATDSHLQNRACSVSENHELYPLGNNLNNSSCKLQTEHEMPLFTSLQLRHIFRAGSSNPFFTSHLHGPSLFHLVFFSTLSKKPSKTIPENSKKLENQAETQGFGTLFNEILGILGTESVSVHKHDSHGFLVSDETSNGSLTMAREYPPGVCGNDEEKLKTKSLSVFEINDTSGSELEDVSPIVHRVTGIVRDEIEMEQRLGNAGVEFTEEVVDKVLKRCFKVPHLGLRFFNWVKMREGYEHTTNTFNTVIHLAGEARGVNLVDGLVEEMERCSCEKNVKTWTLLVSHYGKEKMIGKALLVFEEMKKAGIQPDAVVYRRMLRALCDARKSDLAMVYYKEMVEKEVEMSVGLYKQLLKCLALCGDLASVHVVGDDMIQLSEIPEHSVYNLMLKSLCISGRLLDALELIRSMKSKDISFDFETFETLVKGFCRANKFEDAMEIVEMMKKRNVFDCKVYEVLINESLRRNDVHCAFSLFQDITDSAGISHSTYKNLMKHLFKHNEFQKGIELYEKMVEKGIQLDDVVVTAVAAAYIKQNRIHVAWEIIKSMHENGVKATPKEYSEFVMELCKVPKMNELAKVLNELKASNLNIPADILAQIHSYQVKTGEAEIFYTRDEVNPVDNQRDRAGFVEKPVTDSSASKLNHNNMIQEVCQVLSSSTNWCGVQQKLEKLNIQFTPDLVMEVLHACRQIGGTALKFFSWVGKQSGYNHNAQSYNMAIKVAGQGKDFKHMRSLFHEMRRRGYSVTTDTWTIIIMQYGRTGLTDIALSIFREMRLSGCKPTKSIYNSLITCLCEKKGRKVDEAIKVYQEMVQEGFAPNKGLIETYIGCLCEVNKLSDARSCIESLPKFGYSTPLANSLYIRALCRAGKLEEALALTDEVGTEKDILNQFTYGSLIHALLRKGRLEEALAKMKSMTELGISPTVHVYTALIIHYFKVKEIDKALQILEEMRACNCQPTIITYSAVICGNVRSGRVTDAWNMFHRLKDDGPFPDFRTYSMFINCLCRTNQSEEAIKLLSDMLHNGIFPSTVNFRTIIFGLNREGKQDLARTVFRKKIALKQRRKMILDN